jgi:uncharacterized repeat protein (TIGR01451 family)
VAGCVKTVSVGVAGFLAAVTLGGVAAGAPLATSDTTGTTTTLEDAQTSLSFEKSGPESVVAGERIVYALEVQNTGEVEALDVAVVDFLPGEATEIQYDEGCDLDEEVLVCAVGDLAAEDHVHIAVSFIVEEAGEVTNSAEARATNVSERPGDSAVTTVVPPNGDGDGDGEQVLIFGPTDSTAMRDAVTAAGFEAVSVSAAEWGELTTEDFREYRALLIGDPGCFGVTTIAAAAENASVWGAAVDGNVIIDGTDPVLHGRNDFTDAAVAFAGSSADRTGAYVSLSCYYHGVPAMTPVPLLDAFEPDGFTATGVPGCFNDAHIVADHPALSGISDAYLSNWGCSVHEAFDSWPADFVVLAIARNAGSSYTATDGTVGTPYILARGEGLRVISDITASTAPADSELGTPRTVSATVVEDDVPQVGKTVSFSVISGPHEGTEGTATTDSNGTAVFSYTGSGEGTDAIEATYVDSTGATQTSNRLFVEWVAARPAPPTPPPTTTSEAARTETTPTEPVTTVAEPPPLPPPPVPEEPGTFNAQATAGTVLINGRLATGTIEIESGDVVDAKNGTVEIATDSGRGEFFDGAFKITQSTQANAITQLELVGGDFDSCQARRPAGLRADDKPVRRLWGRGKGKFKTKARFSSATVRGTIWLTEDQCGGSLTLSEDGSVAVYDASLRRTRVLGAGEQYFAESPPPPAPGRFVGDPKGQVIVNGVPVDQDTQIRSGDTVDVRNGSIELTTTSGEAAFYSGRFLVTQTGGAEAYTELTLVGGDFSGCGARKLSSRAKDPPKKNVRSLWGKGKGKFRTKARFSSATVRGTNWLTVDRCDGSLTVVREGQLEVHDFRLDRRVLIEAGGRYLALARGG